ncbi:MAG: hypothetical protein N2C14_18500 [Planctomycetales bacterium]
MGYDGPVTPKTLRERIRGMGREQAVRTAGNHLNQAWVAAGLNPPVEAAEGAARAS